MRKGIVFFLLAFLSACSNLPKVEETFESSDGWHARGRFTYQSDDLNENGNFDWRQSGDEYQVRLYGPLGMGTVRITGEPGMVRIQTGNQDIRSDQPLGLLYQVTGLEIPLNYIPRWLHGQPAHAETPIQSKNSEGMTEGFQEAGWSLLFPSYQQFDLSDQLLPSELIIRGENNELRILIRSFEAL